MLRPHPANPRTISDERFEALKRALAAEPEMMRARPLVALPDGTVVCGNMRLRAAQELGWATVPVVYADLDERRAREWLLRDNQSYGTWDEENLSALLHELEQASGDLDLTGFPAEELLRLLDTSSRSEGDPDHVPPLPTGEPESRSGEIYELGPHRLVCGDATNPDHVARLLDGERARLLFTSPPYLDLREYGGHSTSAAELAQFIPLFSDKAELFAVNLGLVMRDGEIVRYWDPYLDIARGAGLKLLAWNVWNREDATNIAAQTLMTFPLWHEWIFVFGSGQERGHRTIPTKHAGSQTRLGQRRRDGSFVPPRSYVVGRWKPLGSVLTLPSHKGKAPGDHPAVFPVALPREYLRSLTTRGDAVIDLFAGSGSTLVACEELDRRCYAIEIEPRYCDVIRSRYAVYANRPDLAP